MDEAFLSNAMSILGQDGVVSIKVNILDLAYASENFIPANVFWLHIWQKVIDDQILFL